MKDTAADQDGQGKVHIQLLGGFVVSVDGVRLPKERWKSRRARHLVELLALAAGQRLHREQVMEAFWPDSDLSAAANNFHQTLYAARRALAPHGADILRLADDFLRLTTAEAGALTIDVEQFEAAAAAQARAKGGQDPEAIQAALALYTGDLLPEDPYEQWTLQRRETLRQTYLGLLRELARVQEDRQEYVGGIETLQRALSADQTNEETHASLMRIYALNGQRQLALRQYQSLREALQEELEVEPGESITRLYEAIQAGHYPPPVAVSPLQDSRSTPLPTGMVTFLFSDIEGSTPLWERQPQAMPAAVARHHAILREAIANNGGVVFKVVGDQFQAAFRFAHQAVAAAVAAQQALQAEAWPDATGPLRVRMGLHTGPAEPVGDDYAVSHTLNRAARVTAAGYGGQVLLSQETAELVRRALPEGVTLKDLGEQRLKGLEQPERLYQVVVEGLPEDFPRLSTPVMRINNLPAQLTSFVGREKEIGEVSQQVRNNRLVTLTGVGGTGKTRLGLQVAERLLADFPNGVYLVELASLSDPQQVPQEVANAIGMLGSSDLSPEEQLVRYLRPRALLLVLDNCEHLVAACARLADRLLSGCPHLYILATSREGLGVRGEARYPLLPLPFPGSQPLPELDVLMGYAAVQLFVERAALARPGFNLTPQNASAVTRVCQRLDGLPLALELAAAWAYLLSVEQIAARLDDYFHLLVGGGRTLLPRHQTMRAALDWSYELLSEAERVLLRRLAVFAGGWTLEAAEAVCADPPGEPAATGVLASAAILALLSQLVSKSLVTALTTESKPQPEMRYRLLEPIRHYAAEVLEHSPDAGRSVRQRHGAFYLGWLAQRYPDLTGRRQVAAVHAINTEFENIRMAWDWAADQGRLELLLPAARTMCTFCSRDERVQVGEEICRVTAERLAPGTLSDPAASPGGVRLLILLWSTQAYLSGLLDDAPQAEQLLQQAADLLERAKATDLLLNWEEAFFLVQKGNTNWTQLRSAPAQACYEGALQLFHELGDRFWEAETLHVWSYLPNPLEDMRRLQESALVAYRSLGNPGGVAILLQEIGLTACRQGHFEESERLIHESLALCQENHDPFGIALSNFRLGEALLMMGRFAESQPLLAQSLVELEEHGSWMWARQCAAILSETEVHLGNYDRTRQLCQAALAEMHERHFLWGTQVGFRFLLSMACLGDRQPAEAQEWLAKALEQGWPLVSVEDVEIYLHDWMNDRRYRGWYLSLMGTADLQLGQVERAGQHLHAALKIWEQCGDNYVLYFCLPAIALLLAERGETRRAGEVYALARRFNHVVNSRWCSAVFGQPLAVHIGLPEEAFTTDAQLDLNRVVRAMLGESGLFSGYPAQTGQDLFYYS